MQLLPTLVNLDGKAMPLEAWAMPEGKSSPPYYVKFQQRMFLIDPMNWVHDSASNTITANYIEEGPEALPDLSHLKPVKKQEVAA